MELLLIYQDTFWKIWLRMGYLLYLIDCLMERIFDFIIAKTSWNNFASFVRTYGTNEVSTIQRAGAWASFLIDIRDEGENWPLWRCYYGWAIFKETWISYFKKRPKTNQHILSEEEIQQFLGYTKEGKE